MNGPEHYRRAQHHLDDAASWPAGSDDERFHLTAAQVHATLAQAAAALDAAAGTPGPDWELALAEPFGPEERKEREKRTTGQAPCGERYHGPEGSAGPCTLPPGHDVGDDDPGQAPWHRDAQGRLWCHYVTTPTGPIALMFHPEDIEDDAPAPAAAHR